MEPDVAPTSGVQLADWNLLRAFLAVHETGTLTGAARRLGTTQPSMGRHLRELEARIGETLFVRLPGRLQATERADALYAAAAGMQQAVRDAESLLGDGGGRVAGSVRVAVADAHAGDVVPQLLAPLLNEQPELEIELSVAYRADNLLRRDADIAVRFFRPDQDDIVAKKVGSAEMGLYAHESFIARHGMPDGFTPPPGAFVAGFDREPVALAPALRGAAPPERLRFRFRSDSVMARQAVVECGAGVGMYFTDVAAERPGLVRVLADKVGLVQDVWLCAHDELRRSRRMRCVWDRLEAGLAARYAR